MVMVMPVVMRMAHERFPRSAAGNELFQPVDRVIAGLKFRIVDDPAMEWNCRLDPDDGKLVKCPTQPVDSIQPGRRVDDQLCHHAVVERRHEISSV